MNEEIDVENGGYEAYQAEEYTYDAESQYSTSFTANEEDMEDPAVVNDDE